MSILSAENRFKQGLLALVDGDHEGAARYFREAIAIQERRGANRPDWRYLSYYGLSMAKAFRPSDDAIAACRSAALGGRINPELYLNLGRVYALAGKLDRAREAFEHGLRLAPDHPRLREELLSTASLLP